MGVLGEDPAVLVVAVGVVRQAHCAGELPDDGGEGGRGAVLGDDAEIVIWPSLSDSIIICCY